MNSDWIEVTAQCTRHQADTLEAWLFESGALSVTLKDSLDDEHLEHAVLEPVPGEVRLWNDVTLVGLFAQDNSEQQVHEALNTAAKASALEVPTYHLAPLQDQVWERSWMESFKPMQFGHRLWICPTHDDPVDPQAITLRLDPGMAFGTGTHATTAQCLRWLGGQMTDTLQPLAGKTVIDYGCGSGVLAITALLLGASHAWAVDIDEQAVKATHDNAAANGVADRLSVGQPDITEGVIVDVLMANILFKPLMELAGAMAQRLCSGGTLVMSGILEDQIPPLRSQYTTDFQFSADNNCDGWALMTAIRR